MKGALQNQTNLCNTVQINNLTEWQDQHQNQQDVKKIEYVKLFYQPKIQKYKDSKMQSNRKQNVKDVQLYQQDKDVQLSRSAPKTSGHYRKIYCSKQKQPKLHYASLRKFKADSNTKTVTFYQKIQNIDMQIKLMRKSSISQYTLITQQQLNIFVDMINQALKLAKIKKSSEIQAFLHYNLSVAYSQLVQKYQKQISPQRIAYHYKSVLICLQQQLNKGKFLDLNLEEAQPLIMHNHNSCIIHFLIGKINLRLSQIYQNNSQQKKHISCQSYRIAAYYNFLTAFYQAYTLHTASFLEPFIKQNKKLNNLLNHNKKKCVKGNESIWSQSKKDKQKPQDLLNQSTLSLIKYSKQINQLLDLTNQLLSQQLNLSEFRIQKQTINNIKQQAKSIQKVAYNLLGSSIQKCSWQKSLDKSNDAQQTQVNAMHFEYFKFILKPRLAMQSLAKVDEVFILDVIKMLMFITLQSVKMSSNKHKISKKLNKNRVGSNKNLYAIQIYQKCKKVFQSFLKSQQLIQNQQRNSQIIIQQSSKNESQQSLEHQDKKEINANMQDYSSNSNKKAKFYIKGVVLRGRQRLAKSLDDKNRNSQIQNCVKNLSKKQKNSQVQQSRYLDPITAKIMQVYRQPYRSKQHGNKSQKQVNKHKHQNLHKMKNKPYSGFTFQNVTQRIFNERKLQKQLQNQLIQQDSVQKDRGKDIIITNQKNKRTMRNRKNLGQDTI